MPDHDPRASQHAYERAWQRFGIQLDVSDTVGIVSDIIRVVAGERAPAVLLRRLDGPNHFAGRECWLVRCRGFAVRVVYSPASATIVTFLRPADGKRDFDCWGPRRGP